MSRSSSNIGRGTFANGSRPSSTARKAPLSHTITAPAMGSNAARKCCIELSAARREAAWEVDIAGKRYPAVASIKPLYDPEMRKVKCGACARERRPALQCHSAASAVRFPSLA